MTTSLEGAISDGTLRLIAPWGFEGSAASRNQPLRLTLRRHEND
jgi:hypothetical protein